ncbi:MAG: hypothetical protein ACI901_000946, partial [Octadecabacter sp.]
RHKWRAFFMFSVDGNIPKMNFLSAQSILIVKLKKMHKFYKKFKS